MKPALARLRESRAARARELSEEVLAVQERLDAGLEALTERTEENAGLGTQACFCPQPVSPCHLSLLSTKWAAVVDRLCLLRGAHRADALLHSHTSSEQRCISIWLLDLLFGGLTSTWYLC